MGRMARVALFGLTVTAGAAFAQPSIAQAQTEATAISAAYETVGRWLFELYLNQSIRLTVANIAQTRPDAPTVLAPQIPAIARLLDRHRDDFVRAMHEPMRVHLTPTDAVAFAMRLAKPPVELDDAMRNRLIAVDSVFRRDGQKAIRAITFDLGTIVAEALAAAPPNRQN